MKHSIVDLTLPVQRHWRWLFHKTIERDYTMGGPLREEFIYMPVHCFTHIDPPAHAVDGGLTIDQLPLERLIRAARVLDMSEKPANGEISAEDLARVGEPLRPGEIAIIRTGQTMRHSVDEAEFWTTAPYLSESAARWLVEKSVSAAAFDFPQDYVLREFFEGRIPAIDRMVVHKTLLNAGVAQIEYVTNLEKLPEDGITLFAIPLKLVGMSGSPARVFAAVD